jgi:hypothetical protein
VSKVPEGRLRGSSAFGTPSGSSIGELRDLLWERRDECLGVVPVLVCYDEVVVECDVQQATDVWAGLEKAVIEGMDVVLNDADEVEARIATSWGEGGWPYVQMHSLEESGTRSSSASRSAAADLMPLTSRAACVRTCIRSVGA